MLFDSGDDFLVDKLNIRGLQASAETLHLHLE
jgi:hypothetical protein